MLVCYSYLLQDKVVYENKEKKTSRIMLTLLPFLATVHSYPN